MSATLPPNNLTRWAPYGPDDWLKIDSKYSIDVYTQHGWVDVNYIRMGPVLNDLPTLQCETGVGTITLTSLQRKDIYVNYLKEVGE